MHQACVEGTADGERNTAPCSLFHGKRRSLIDCLFVTADHDLTGAVVIANRDNPGGGSLVATVLDVFLIQIQDCCHAG